MQTHELVQGSPQWIAHRFNHFNASDAPAMLGVSPYKSRSDLLRELATGLSEDLNDRTRSLFDRGHRYEALARPLGEEIIGEELYPVVGTEGRLSASFDGLTMLEEVAFEHKMLNDSLRASMVDGCAGADLPMAYQVQMEQQCMVAGCDRVLFMATTWTDDDVLVEKRHCWYTANPELADKILRGWEQFALDLAAWKPTESAPVVAATAVEHLPALSVRLQGALAVVSNLEPFGVALRAFVDRIPKKPNTDQEFADTEAACKRLKEAEERLQAAEDSALASMTDVETMRRMVSDFRELARTTRLASEKLVKQRKEQIREEEVTRGHSALTEHLAALNKRLGGAYIAGLSAGNFGVVIKGLKSLDSVRNAIDTELARAKIEASAMADKIDANLKAIDAIEQAALFPDKKSLVLKDADDLAAIIAQRVAAEQKRQDDERERIRVEEAARIERETAERQRREAEGRMAIAFDEARRRAGQDLPYEIYLRFAGGHGNKVPLENVDEYIAALNALQRVENIEARDSQQVLKAEPVTADATDRDAPVNASPSVGSMGAGQAADAAAVGGTGRIGVTLASGLGRRVAVAVDTRPPIKLGDICARLGFTVTRSFIEDTLGITPSGTAKAAVLWPASAWEAICDGIVNHITEKKGAF